MVHLDVDKSVLDDISDLMTHFCSQLVRQLTQLGVSLYNLLSVVLPQQHRLIESEFPEIGK